MVSTIHKSHKRKLKEFYYENHGLFCKGCDVHVFVEEIIEAVIYSKKVAKNI